MLRVLFVAITLFYFSWDSYAWNALGHQLIAQIAYDNLTPKAREISDAYVGHLKHLSTSSRFIQASTWLDAIKIKNIHWFDNLHYIDIPFSEDKTELPAIQKINALWGIQHALSIVSSQKSSFSDKSLSLRILMHLVGDIHQPLHTATKISKFLPQGDKGGNLFPLGKNFIGYNLHQYWDNGAGFLRGKTKQLRNKTLYLEKKWPCILENIRNNPEQWVKESHKLALSQAYKIEPYQVPSKKYKLNAQNTTKKQIALAGCRLASLLNSSLLRGY